MSYWHISYWHISYGILVMAPLSAVVRVRPLVQRAARVRQAGDVLGRPPPRELPHPHAHPGVVNN